MPAMGLDHHDVVAAEDLVTGASWQWGENVYVRVGPETEPVHIVAIRRF
jgi:starch synthase (maltosyl-transferring)